MGTNKERIEIIEKELGGLHEGIQGVTSKIQSLEETITRLSDSIMQNQLSSTTVNQDNQHRDRQQFEHGVTSKIQQIEESIRKFADSSGNARGSGSLTSPDPSKSSFLIHGRNTTGTGRSFQSKLTKLEFPKFSGGDPTIWINRVDQFCAFQEVAVEDKVRLASFHLEGEANYWWQWYKKTMDDEHSNITWETFEDEIRSRFGPTEADDFDEALTRIRQVGTLRDYQQEFEQLSTRVRGWTQKALVGAFMGGLKWEIAEGIRIFKPKSIKEAMSLARIKDDEIRKRRAHFVPRTTSKASGTSSRPIPSTVKKLTWDEMQKRRAQGLCFNCPEKFTAGHRCQGPTLMLLEEPHVMGENFECEADPIGSEEEPEITLHALTGWLGPRTMRIEVGVANQKLIALIDSGSTHNFFNDRIARRLNFPINPITQFHVRVANGEQIRCQGKYNNIEVIAQGNQFLIDFFSIPLHGIDMVLGNQWLETLGMVHCDWKNLTMSFEINQKATELQGIQEKQIQDMTLAQLTHVDPNQQTLFVLCPMEVREANQHHHPELQPLLVRFTELFKEPTQLPHSREVEHQIVLKDGVDAVNVRPYRYAHFQKEEIEKQVQ